MEGGQKEAVSNGLLIHGSPVYSPLVLRFNAVDVLRGQTPLAVDLGMMLELALPQPRERVIRFRGSAARATRARLLAAGVVLQDAGPIQQAVQRALQIPRQTAGGLSARVSAHPPA